MIKNLFSRSLIYLVYLTISHSFCDAALIMPSEIQEAFRRSSTTEDGGIFNPDGQREVVVDYVKTHWEDLLDNLDEIPSEGNTRRSAIMLVGLAAEELPPEEYINFLDHYLTLYSKGDIPSDVLGIQLSGRNRKNYFLDVNHAHKSVTDLLAKARTVIPETDVELHERIDAIASGELSDMYYANTSDDAPPPETLPGIKLRRPFESLIGELHRNRRESDEATRRKRLTGDTLANTKAGETAEIAGSAWKTWGLAGALALLLLAVGALFKRRTPVPRPR